jgi:hypothetical protein
MQDKKASEQKTEWNPKNCGSDERQCRWGLDEAEKTKHPPNEVESSMLKSQMLKEVAATRREKRSRTNTPDKMGITGTPR